LFKTNSFYYIEKLDFNIAEYLIIPNGTGRGDTSCTAFLVYGDNVFELNEIIAVSFVIPQRVELADNNNTVEIIIHDSSDSKFIITVNRL